MKLVTYNPKEVKNIPEFLNKYLDEYKNEKYIIFAFNDVIEHVKDKQALTAAYRELLEKTQIPFAFFSYYIHFNKILPDIIGKPSARITIHQKDGYMFDVVGEPAYGLMILDVEKLNSINFKFDTEFKTTFYIQDLIKKCKANNLYFSGVYFIDVHNSFELFDSDFKNGQVYDLKTFGEEKKAFFDKYSAVEPEQINDYVNELKKRYGTTVPQMQPLPQVVEAAQTDESETKQG